MKSVNFARFQMTHIRRTREAASKTAIAGVAYNSQKGRELLNPGYPFFTAYSLLSANVRRM